MSHVFISYAREDAVYVRGLAAWLTRGGVSVWMDDEIPTAHSWEQVLIHQIETCGALLLVMSPDSGASEWVAREVNLAQSLGKPIHPLWLRGEIVLGMESVQLEDVRHGGLPSPDFLARLRGIAPLRRSLRYQFGTLPPEAAFFQHRRGPDMARGGTWILHGLGGVGKSQLAADAARGMAESGTLDLLMWVSATSRSAVVTAYAQAALQLVPGADPLRPEESAQAFLQYLSSTTASWLVVLDDLQDPNHLAGLWPPQTDTGRVLITTRRTDAGLLSRGTAVPVDLYTPAEARAYLAAVFAADPGRLAGSAEMADDLGYLPLALAQAAAYIADERITCAEYRRRFADTQVMLNQLAPGYLPDDYTRSVAVSLALSIEAANQTEPRGLAGPMLNLLSMLDPDGVPIEFLAANATWSYLERFGSGRVFGAQADGALQALVRFSLVTGTIGTEDNMLARVHALVQRSARDRIPSDRLDDTVRAAADALLAIWPRVDAKVGPVLRANTDALWSNAGVRLFHPHAHDVLHRAGLSLERNGLASAAIEHFTQVLDQTSAVLGPEHPDTAIARNNLAMSYESAGHVEQSVSLYEAVLADQERLLGPDHPTTLTTRNNLASAYGTAGRMDRAIALHEAVLADVLRVLGPDNRDTITARNNLADDYRQTRQLDKAIGLLETNLAAAERVLGPDDEMTLAARNNLAGAYEDASKPDLALPLFEAVLAGRRQLLGPDHPDTLAVRSNVASALMRLGEVVRAVAEFEATVADVQRVLGPDHRLTLTLRNNLAGAYEAAGKPELALPIYEDVLIQRLRLNGPDHPDIVTARNNFAGALRGTGQLERAISEFQGALADAERILSTGHPLIMSVRENLAATYEAAGRPQLAIPLHEASLQAFVWLLGPDDRASLAARARLAEAYAAVGDKDKAISAYEYVLAAMKRLGINEL